MLWFIGLLLILHMQHFRVFNLTNGELTGCINIFPYAIYSF